MSADRMPCGCDGHFDLIDQCNFPPLASAARFLASRLQARVWECTHGGRPRAQCEACIADSDAINTVLERAPVGLCKCGHLQAEHGPGHSPQCWECSTCERFEETRQ
ncbi:hypothetical protein MYSTI_01909 [Myxococcus stipitatus DSM 14675]|uniref:Uncharacterized protein n=1 Tax=Myxococcus stipitatus (strain DSM 14675 / JCM 12634 / Mx s8) TaxID=1278073 RepID=L7U5V6_MYXSD|nr:hypothetical protein MYSTI_01909 [Myxococcus stipitatus DSM 14675]